MKNFDEWNEIKKDISVKENIWTIKEREIYWLYLGKNIGYEQDGKDELFLKPVLILKIFNKHLFYGIPLTTKGKDNKFYHKFEICDKENYAILSQMRLFDKKRIHDRLGKIKSDEFNVVRQKLKELLDL